MRVHRVQRPPLSFHACAWGREEERCTPCTPLHPAGGRRVCAPPLAATRPSIRRNVARGGFRPELGDGGAVDMALTRPPGVPADLRRCSARLTRAQQEDRP